MCEVKQILLKYECLIFDKTFVDDIKRDNLGNWNPSFQETMLRGMYFNNNFLNEYLSEKMLAKKVQLSSNVCLTVLYLVCDITIFF